jgi:DNA-binding NarL/FixJ family response regulator
MGEIGSGNPCSDNSPAGDCILNRRERASTWAASRKRAGTARKATAHRRVVRGAIKPRTEPHDRAAGVLLGADDCFTKPIVAGELLARMASHARAAAPHLNQHTVDATLTPSELRVLRQLARGVPTKTIARELSITPKTVAMHIHNAMKKLDVHTRAQAVALAHQHGLVGPPVTDTSSSRRPSPTKVDL